MVRWLGQFSPLEASDKETPLSPYMFIICVEGLSFLLQAAERNMSIHGICVARGAPSVSHLLFADDSLVFFKATSIEAEVVIKILENYKKASSQLVNYHKSSVTFSKNIGLYQREELRGIWT